MREKLLDLEAKNERLSQEVQDEVHQHDATKRKLDRVRRMNEHFTLI